MARPINGKRTGRAGGATALCAALLLAACEGPETDTGSDTGAAFERLATDGGAYQGNGDYATAPWACVRDIRTGLVWEVKSTASGLHHRDHTYSWYSEHPDHNRDPGERDGGECSGSQCDTQAFAVAVRAEGLCGFHDWRVPGRSELGSLVDRTFAKGGAAIDPTYFPNAKPAEYWSFTAYAFYPGTAWAWNFDLGYDRVDRKIVPKHTRLVRGEPKRADQ